MALLWLPSLAVLFWMVWRLVPSRRGGTPLAEHDPDARELARRRP
jgi:hypothetical protein